MTGMAIQRVEPAAAHELVVQEIRRAIHMGSYVPGDRLPAERALAEQLGVSRATLREAIGVLREEGYVESRRGAHGGMVVLDQGLDEERMRPVVQERLAEFEELLDLRAAIEGAAARLAAERRTAADLKALTAAFDGMAQGLETERFRAADSAFHLAIAARRPQRADAAGDRGGPRRHVDPHRPPHRQGLPQRAPSPRADVERHPRARTGARPSAPPWRTWRSCGTTCGARRRPARRPHGRRAERPT